MEEGRIVYRFQKNPEEEVRFSVKAYKDRQYLDLRLWFQTSEKGEFFPTKKGLTLSLDYLSELKKGFDRVQKAAQEIALQQEPQSVK